MARQLLLHWVVYKHSDLTNLRVDEEQGHFTLRQQQQQQQQKTPSNTAVLTSTWEVVKKISLFMCEHLP